MSKFKNCLMLFFEFFKIGLFTFGGGYAMIAVIERTIVERKKWIDHDEYLDVVAIAESTPGPIAINAANSCVSGISSNLEIPSSSQIPIMTVPRPASCAAKQNV